MYRQRTLLSLESSIFLTTKLPAGFHNYSFPTETKFLSIHTQQGRKISDQDPPIRSGLQHPPPPLPPTLLLYPGTPLNHSAQVPQLRTPSSIHEGHTPANIERGAQNRRFW